MSAHHFHEFFTMRQATENNISYPFVSASSVRKLEVPLVLYLGIADPCLAREEQADRLSAIHRALSSVAQV